MTRKTFANLVIQAKKESAGCLGDISDETLQEFQSDLAYIEQLLLFVPEEWVQLWRDISPDERIW